jgi:hypothetical protein
MAAIPTFIGVGGPILSLTGEQRTEYAPLLRDNSFCVATSELLNLNSTDCVLPPRALARCPQVLPLSLQQIPGQWDLTLTGYVSTSRRL